MKKYTTVILTSVLIITCIIFNVLMSKRFYSGQNVLRPDERLYNQMALGILNGNDYYVFNDKKVDIGVEVSPLFPAFVAAAYFVGGVNVKNAYILHVIFNCLTIVLLFLTIRLITKKNLISFLFSLAFLIYYPLWKMNFTIMMEVSTVFFLSLTIYLFSKYYYDKSIKYLYFSTAAFSLLCLINNRFIVLLFTFFAFLLLFVILNKINFRKVVFTPFIIAMLIISPWFIRQCVVYDQFVFFTPAWNNIVANKFGLLNRISVPSSADAIDSGKPDTYEEYCKYLNESYTKEDQKGRKSAFTLEKYENIVANHNSQENIYLFRLKKVFSIYNRDFQFAGPNDYQLILPSSKSYIIIQILVLLPLFILSLFGFIISVRKKELYVIFLGALFFSFVLLHVLIYYTDRYRLTILPVLLLIAAYGFSEALRMLKRNYLTNGNTNPFKKIYTKIKDVK